MACADVATAKAKAATAINLNISFLPCFGFKHRSRLVQATLDPNQTAAGRASRIVVCAADDSVNPPHGGAGRKPPVALMPPG
jgi:hypothetical protein